MFNPYYTQTKSGNIKLKKNQRIIKENNITQSISRKGNCLDNSVMENFFGRLKTEMFYGEKFESVNTFMTN